MERKMYKAALLDLEQTDPAHNDPYETDPTQTL